MAAPHPRRNPPPDSFSTLYHAHKARVRRAARLSGVAARDAPDVVQEVFIDLAKAMRGQVALRSVGGWLVRVSYRKAQRLLRAQHEGITETGELIDLPSDAPTPEDNVMAIDVYEHVYAILDELPKEQRLVFVMKRIEGMEMRDIAETLEIPLDTGLSRLRAAEQKFKSAWEARQRTHASALLPILHWSADDVLAEAKNTVPELPKGLDDEVWNRIVERLAEDAERGDEAGAPTPPAGKLSVLPWVMGMALSLLPGACFYDLTPPPCAPEAPQQAVNAAAAPSSVRLVEEAPIAPVASGTATVQARVSAPPRQPEDNAEADERSLDERSLIEGARVAITIGDYSSALEALDLHERRYPHGRWTEHREMFRARARSLLQRAQEEE